MPKTAALVPPLREARKLQSRLQERSKKIAQTWIAWLEYLKGFEQRPIYFERIHRLVARISHERALEKNRYGRNICWDDARDRVLTNETLESIAQTFGIRHSQIYTDVSRIANHASWLAGVYRRGEGGILYDVQRELQKRSATPPPEIREPAKPVPMTAAEIVRHVREANERFQKAEREFLGDPTPHPIGKTATFGFFDAIAIDRTKRKPRRNYRRETGL